MINEETKRWIKTEADERAVANGCYFDESSGVRVVNFFHRFLRFFDGEFAGKPFDLMDWQRDDIVLPIFGWKRPDGTRRFRTAYVEIPKKNGKTSMMAAFSLYFLVGDNEPGAEVYSAALKRDQAAMIFSKCVAMLQHSPMLAKRLRVRNRDKKIDYGKTHSFYQALAADADSNEGLNCHALICDELHAWRDRQYFDALRYSGAARRQPMLAVITTAGDSRESVGWELHDQAIKVRDGLVLDESFFSYIRAIDPTKIDDWENPVHWLDANPSLQPPDAPSAGYPLKFDAFQTAANEAAQVPARKRSFWRYRLNYWVDGVTEWLPMERWDDECAEPFDESELVGRPCYAGLDLATNRDLSALALAFRMPHDEVWLKLFFWMAEEYREQLFQDTSGASDLWIENGYIRLTSGNVTDFNQIRYDISGSIENENIDSDLMPSITVSDTYDIQELSYDPHRATQLALQLQGDGMTVFPHRQGFISMAEPCEQFERLILGGKIRHNLNPVLRYCAAHTVVKEDPSGNKRPDKAKSRFRIDGVVASIMAVGRSALAQKEPEWNGEIMTL